MYNDHRHDVNYSHPLGEDLADNKYQNLSSSVQAVEHIAPDEEQEFNDGSHTERDEEVDPATQRIFQFVYNSLQVQEDEGSIVGLTYEQIQDGTTYGYSFIKSRMPEILKTNQIMVEPGSGRRPSRFFLPHQYLERQAKRENDAKQLVSHLEEDESYDDEQAARKTVLASMKKEHERLTKLFEEIQSELKDRESAIRILEKDINKR
jgi:hypothetical protein